MQEDVNRTTVENEVVHIHQQIGLLFGSHYFEAIERSRAEVERLHKVLFIASQLLLLAHLLDGNLYGLFQIGGLYDALFAITKVNGHLWMCLDKCLDGLGKCCSIRILLELNAVWNIVQRRCRILQTVEIDASLGVGERDTVRGER